jgi:hypothetical protein
VIVVFATIDGDRICRVMRPTPSAADAGAHAVAQQRGGGAVIVGRTGARDEGVADDG